MVYAARRSFVLLSSKVKSYDIARALRVSISSIFVFNSVSTTLNLASNLCVPKEVGGSRPEYSLSPFRSQTTAPSLVVVVP